MSKSKWIALAIAAAAWFFFTWKPSPQSIAKGIEVINTEEIVYDGQSYFSQFGPVEDIAGDLRLKKRNYDKNIPIVTTDLIITTGEFSDPDVVTITSKGKGNYYWRAPKKPTGSLVVYHVIPLNEVVQSRMSDADEGVYVEITGRIADNNEIKNQDGYFLRLMHSNHKFILASEVRLPR